MRRRAGRSGAPRTVPVGNDLLVVVTFDGDIAPLTAAGFIPGTVIGDMATGAIPPNKVQALGSLPNVQRVDRNRAPRYSLVTSIPEIGADKAQKPPQGSGLMGYDGTGVIVGVIDGSFDYRHSSFRKADGTTRILKLWNQTGHWMPGLNWGQKFSDVQINAALQHLADPNTGMGIPYFNAANHGGHATAGAAVTFHAANVIDSFGEKWQLQVPQGWSLFSVSGLNPSSLLVWPTVATPLEGPVLEDVALGQDDDANVLWAVEQRVNGRDLPSTSQPSQELASGDTVSSGPRTFAYRPTSPMGPYWHPYVVAEVKGRRRYVQGRLADLSGASPALLPEPRASVLYDRTATASDPAHQIEPATVPANGIRLERRMMLARGSDGQPVLWSQRRRLPLLAPPSTQIHWDRLLMESGS